MHHQIIQDLHTLLYSYQQQTTLFPSIRQYLSAEPLKNFHPWADGKNFIGGFLIHADSGTNMWLLLINWRKDEYYIVLYPEDKSCPIAELHKSIKDGNHDCLQWTYSPTKRDGKNSERKKYFKKYFLSLDVTISIPSAIHEVSDFLNELLCLAENRVKADSLDSISPEYREGFPEGKLKERRHKSRERNAQLIKQVKAETLKAKGKLTCQCCGFDFEKMYGDIGTEFIEAHHTKPVSELHDDGEMTKKEDIALVCANCHRMLHRKRPWLTMEDLEQLITENEEVT